MTELRLSFEHDPEKAAVNLHKHGVSFEEAVTSFFDLDAISASTQSIQPNPTRDLPTLVSRA
jgi:uncharacterized DUF497 family protein